MSTQEPMSGPPTGILLATDLSARCDRALDRAAQLARAWAAKLTVLTVIEGRQTPDELYAWLAREQDDRESFIRKQLTRELIGLDVPFDVHVGEGDVASVITDIAANSNCGLVITGMARNETFGRFIVGSTVERLARTLPQPLLVVRSRVRGPYRRIAVATDFSEPSRHALQAAARLFPDQPLTLYHAYGPGIGPEKLIKQNILEGECAEFLAQSGLSPECRRRLRIVIERHEVEIALPRYVRTHETDLVVLGTHGRSHLLNVLLGRSAARLVELLSCDTLLVRQPPPAG